MIYGDTRQVANVNSERAQPIATRKLFSHASDSFLNNPPPPPCPVSPPSHFSCSGGRAIGPGGAAASGASMSLSRGGSDVTIEGRGGQQYLMTQGGQRISSGKSTIFNGVEIGKEVKTNVKKM